MMPGKKPRAQLGPFLFPELEEERRNGQANGVPPKIAMERLPTNTTTRQHPIHRWFNFIAGFSPEFVNECLDSVPRCDCPPVFLDPFSGCATGPLVSCQRGIRAIGYEPHPFFFRIARAKLPGPDAISQLDQIERVLGKGFGQPGPLSLLPKAPEAFLRKLFPEDSLESLLGARQALYSAGLVTNDLAFLVLSRVFNLSSHSQTDGIYKAPTSRKEPTSPAAAFQETVRMIRSDLEHARGCDYQALACLHQASSEEMGEVATGSVSLIVTSPPYLNNFDFAEMTRMYLYFWEMATSWGEITDTCQGTSTVTQLVLQRSEVCL
jgi:hypothetical protein